MNDGGPAFPVPASFRDEAVLNYTEFGMSLRDWFAGMALQGSLANSNVESCPPEELPEAAKRIYRIADAMLAARSS